MRVRAFALLTVAACNGKIANFDAGADAIGADTAIDTQTYTTKFPTTESWIYESGRWLTGKTQGVDWSDVQTTPGLAWGTESGTSAGPWQYDDSLAVLTGDWGPDQTVQATVFSVDQTDTIVEEVELRLRSSLGAHVATGYKVSFRCSKTANAYAQILRWDGPIGSSTVLAAQQGTSYGVADGDLVMATISGNVITAYINGVHVLEANDDVFTSGNPGMGFFLQGASAVNGKYGFTTFSASAH